MALFIVTIIVLILLLHVTALFSSDTAGKWKTLKLLYAYTESTYQLKEGVEYEEYFTYSVYIDTQWKVVKEYSKEMTQCVV